MPQPRVLILRAPGTNCNEETAHAFTLAGAVCEQVHVLRLLESPAMLDDYQVFCLPGGFSYGDDIAAGRILGGQVRRQLGDAMQRFRDAGKLVLGVCNGFQVLMATGLLGLEDPSGPLATLTRNDSGRFEARWVRLSVAAGECVFLRGIEQMELPVAHAEGKFVCREGSLPTLGAQAVLRYTTEGGGGTAYPANPNGSADHIAGVCDPTGRVLGLMPHPERFVDPTQHPQWTRRREGGNGVADGLKVFQNAVAHFG
ncbi:MAG: phosphoribosylformylglycinamidine synthase I [Planctomycetota bacterium]